MTLAALLAFLVCGLAAALPLAWLGDHVMNVFRDDAGDVR